MLFRSLYLDTNNKLCKNISAKHLLLWKMIEKYSHEKFTRFNLGGVSDPRLTDNKFKGLNDFKTNFNASIIEYGGDFELVTNAPKYFIYQQTIQKPSLRK